jgi:Skp family chaperone for outer membrane proteins
LKVKSSFVIRPVVGATLLALGMLASAGAQTPSAAAPTGNKVGVIEIQAAIFQTKDGQKALADLQTKFNPKKTEFERRRAEIAGTQDQHAE